MMPDEEVFVLIAYGSICFIVVALGGASAVWPERTSRSRLRRRCWQGAVLLRRPDAGRVRGHVLARRWLGARPAQEGFG